MGKIYDHETWIAIGREVATIGEDVARDWWREHGGLLAEYTREQVETIAQGMCCGPEGARDALFATLPPDEAVALFRAWNLDTTNELQGIASRRAQLLHALRELAIGLLPAVGQAILRGLSA